MPSGKLHVVAWFPAERALGWVHAGAPARVRLDAFPWTWFGQIAARVSDVALEPSDGLLRVELALVEPIEADIPLRHGLTGGVEIEVEETTPLALLLRAAGRQTHDSPPGPTPQAP